MAKVTSFLSHFTGESNFSETGFVESPTNRCDMNGKMIGGGGSKRDPGRHVMIVKRAPAFPIFMKYFLTAFLLGIALAPGARVPVIFDTDMGNDVDDVMALAMLNSLQRRGHCELLAVTVSKDHELAAPFIDAINTFYGNPDVPVGTVRNGATKDEGKFLKLANATTADGKLIFPHDLRSGKDVPEAVGLIRKTLASQPDGSVVMIQVGFFTNLSRLLDSKADATSELTGEELVRKKVRLLSLMAGAFKPIDGNPRYAEYNVARDVPAAQSLANRWPTPAYGADLKSASPCLTRIKASSGIFNTSRIIP